MITDPADVPREATGHLPTLTNHPQFDHCATGTRPTGPIDALWRWGEGRTQLCENAEPWWTNIWFTVSIACIAAGLAEITDTPYLARAAVVVMGFLFALVVTDIANPRNHHGYCEICGQCSAGADVPAARTQTAAITQMTQHGWTTHPIDRHRHHCTGHAHIPFTNPA